MPVIVADKNSVTDGSAYDLLSRVNTDKTIVLVAWSEKYEFNPALLRIKGGYILCCFCEYGWDANLAVTHVWGENSSLFPRYYNNDWVKFDNWVKENPPRILLKRELLKKDANEKRVPIEYPARTKSSPESRDQFNNRPISVFNYWGRSHEGRLILHGNIWIEAPKNGYSVCDNIYQLNQFLQDGEWSQRWVTLAIPHYARQPIETVLQVNAVSKISISMPGAGHKCFRHCESSSNAVMAMEKKELAWAYDWNETNSIQFEIGNEIPTILEALKKEDLYEIYLRGVDNCRKYYIDDYVRDYLEPLINA